MKTDTFKIREAEKAIARIIEGIDPMRGLQMGIFILRQALRDHGAFADPVAVRSARATLRFAEDILAGTLTVPTR